MLRLVFYLTLALSHHDGLEPTDRLIPAGWQGNPWGPEATAARLAGELPTITLTSTMTQWDAWGRKVLRDGDIVFRLGDARVLGGMFPFSRFIARVSGSRYSHTGIVAVEADGPVVYDITKAGVRRQPFCVWTLDNIGPIGVKRLRAEHRGAIPEVLRYVRGLYEQQAVPFDFNMELDDRALYCVEMTEKAFRAAGLPLSEPVKFGNLENATRYPIRVILFLQLSAWTLERPLTLEQAAYFPGNERHGIWASPLLQTVYPAPGRSQASASASGRRGGSGGN